MLVLGFPILVVRPLHNLLHRIEQIADGDGDLRVRLDVLSHDELGELSHAHLPEQKVVICLLIYRETLPENQQPPMACILAACHPKASFSFRPDLAT